MDLVNSENVSYGRKLKIRTFSLSGLVTEWLKSEAERHGTSVSSHLNSLLTSLMHESDHKAKPGA